MSFHNVAVHWTADYQRKAERIQLTDTQLLDEMLHVALDNAIECEVSNQAERQLYWLRCAMLARDERRRRS